MTLFRQRLLVFFVPLFLALPFLNRAYFVDDHFFVEIARWIKDNPLHPYDFPSEGVQPSSSTPKEEIALRIVNPLLHHYYLAGLIKLGGEREWFLRLGCVLASCFSGLLILGLARRWTSHPLLTTLLIEATPVFWLTSYSLLIDSTLTFFFLASLLTFIRACERDSIPDAILCGAAIGATMLSKYNGVLIFPLTGIWWILERKNIKRTVLPLIAWIIGAVIFLAYVGATKSLYGKAHVFTSSGATLHMVNIGKILVLLTFLSGGAIAPLIVWGAQKTRTVVWGCLILAVLTSILSSSFGGFSFAVAFQISIWVTTSLILLGSFLLNFSRWNRPSDMFLLIWLFGFLAMMSVVMQWVAVRYFMMAAPVLILIVVRLVEIERPKSASKILTAGLTLTLLMGAGIGYADYRQADASRSVINELKNRNLGDGGANFYFAGAYTMTYLDRSGWKPFPGPVPPKVGDHVIMSDISMPVSWFLREKIPAKPIALIEFPAQLPIKVMDVRSGAGFYASAWGPLPFAFSASPWERFYLFEIIPPS